MGEVTYSPSSPPTGIVKFLHDIPHFSFQFNNVSPDFDPKSSEYQEAIGIFVFAPLAWMGVWLAIYFIYFSYFYCVRNCKFCNRFKPDERKGSSRPGKWCSFFFSIFSLIVLVICLFMNEFLHSHISSSQQTWNGIRETFHNIENQVLTTQWRLESINETTGLMIHKIERDGTLNETMRPLLKSYAEGILSNMSYSALQMKRRVSNPFTQIDTNITSRLSQYSHLEIYRRYSSHAVIASAIVILALTLCSIGTKQNVFMLLCVAFVILLVMALWLAAGFYSGLSVAVADFCADPQSHSPMLELKADMLPVRGSTEVLNYYTNCGDAASPFSEIVEECSAALTAVQSSIDDLAVLAESLNDNLQHAIAVPQFNITNTRLHISDLSPVLHCKTVNDMYTESLRNICDSAITSIAVIAGGFIISGFLIIFLVFTLHSASRFAGNRRSYQEVDGVEMREKRRSLNETSATNYRFSHYDSSDSDVVPRAARNSASRRSAGRQEGRQEGRSGGRQSYPANRPRNGPPAGRRPKTSHPTAAPSWNPNVR